MTKVVSKLGIHSQGGDNTGLQDHCRTLLDAGRRPAVVDSHDNFSATYDAAQIDPSVLTMGDLTLFEASFDIAVLREKARLNPQVKVWQIFNEWNGDWVAQTDQLIEIMNLYGKEFRFCIYNCAKGTPQYPEIDPVPYEQVARACKVALAGGHLLGLHEYGYESPDLVFRYRKLAEYLRAHDALCDIVITEAGPDEGSFIGVEAFEEWCEMYDFELMRDPYIVAAALWSMGRGAWAGVDFSSALPALAEYQITVQPIEPDPDPIPLVESYNGEWAALGHSLYDATGAVWTLIPDRNPEAGYRVMRSATQHAGGQAEVLKYWQHEVYVANAKDEWYRATIESWQRVTGDPQLVNSPPLPDNHLLAIPWVGQNTVRADDDYSKSDCGPASLAMWLHSRGKNVFVDLVSLSCWFRVF